MSEDQKRYYDYLGIINLVHDYAEEYINNDLYISCVFADLREKNPNSRGGGIYATKQEVKEAILKDFKSYIDCNIEFCEDGIHERLTGGEGEHH